MANHFRWFILSVFISSVSAAVRHYYIAAVEQDWDYAPSGKNLVGENNQMFRDNTERRIDRIGRVYRKVLYRGFIDATFTTPLPREPWEGILGPTIRAEVEDTVYIHFRNMASNGRFSVHPHGFFYSKANEGALHLDGTGGADKADDAVPPGGSYTYKWLAAALHRPTDDDDNCGAWGYHSHTRAHKDIDSGLAGMIVICKPGFLTPSGRRTDVHRELVVYSDIADENESWFIEHNLNNCGDPAICRRLRSQGNEDFRQSNTMHHINGYVYGNLPDFHVCEGEKVAVYFMSLNLGLHPMHINGQTMVIQRKRTDTAVVAEGTFLTGHMIPTNPGRWLLYCRNQYHFAAGMQAFLNVERCKGVYYSPLEQHNTKGPVRKYFLAIEETIWDYAPNLKTTRSSATTFLSQASNRIGSLYKKAVFREYLDDTFTTPKPRGIHDLHHGLAGPPITAEVGDHVVVVVLNKAPRPYSFLANGVTITKKNEGAAYKQYPKDPYPTGNIVNPGAVGRYEFDVLEGNSPTVLDEACLTHVYHSAVDLQRDIYTGLFGPLLVCKKGSLTKSGYQKVVDREFFLNWMVIDENLSWYIDHNIRVFARMPSTVNKEDPEFERSNRIRAINGRTFGTLEGLEMCLHEHVAWHMYGLGESRDHHHFSFDSNNFRHDGRQIDTSSVFPGVGKTVSMVPDQAGRHSLRTGQLGYENEGMYAWYIVMMCPKNKMAARLLPPSLVPNVPGVVRRYFIGAVEGEWDYCPSKISPINGRSLWNPEGNSFKFIRGGPDFVGSVYLKAFYREFTDESFTKMVPRGESERHLGILGPFIRGNVGDTIEIVFKNMASRSHNIVPRNLVFADGSPVTSAPATLPGDTTMYTYIIPERSGPGDKEPNCVGTIYSSRVNSQNDTYTGLFGPGVICKPGVLDFAGRRTDDVSREFAVAFVIMDENLSHYKDFNFRTRAPGRRNISETEFVDSNSYSTINGLIYGNLKGLVFDNGERAAWYIFGIGSTFDVHTVHFHGQLYLRSSTLALKRDVQEVYPGIMETTEMLGYNPGTWLLHCHVSIHASDGMQTTYTVLPRKQNNFNNKNHVQGTLHVQHQQTHHPVMKPPVKSHYPFKGHKVPVNGHHPFDSHKVPVNGHHPFDSHKVPVNGHHPFDSHKVPVNGHHPFDSHKVEVFKMMPPLHPMPLPMGHMVY